jgi:hypothetical protein
MREADRLHLYEQIMLLALRDEEGTIFSGSMYNFAIGGAVLAELLMEKRVDIDTVRKKKFARVLNAAPLGDPFIDQSLSRMVRRRILRVDEDKILGIFTRKVYPEVDPVPEREVIERLRETIFGESRAIDPRTVVLLSLASSADLLRHVFDRKEIKARKARIEQVVNGELTGTATKEAIEAMQAAVVVACIVPAIVASTAAH